MPRGSMQSAGTLSRIEAEISAVSPKHRARVGRYVLSRSGAWGLILRHAQHHDAFRVLLSCKARASRARSPVTDLGYDRWGASAGAFVGFFDPLALSHGFREMSAKPFKLSKDQIAPVALGVGGCLATDRIVVDGCKVGYMYREPPLNDMDSGWRFFAGDEDASYMADAAHHGVYDVNTIANYDPDIVPFLRAEVGSRFDRVGGGSLRRLEPGE